MMNSQDTLLAGSWTALSIFELRIDSGSQSLYCNGRQQVKIEIRLRATNSTEVVKLSTSERASLRLIQTANSQEIPAVPGGGNVTSGWGRTIERNVYDYFPGSVRDQTRDRDAVSRDDERFYLYVQTVAAEPLRISAQIRRDDGVFFRSNAPEFASEGEVTAIPVSVPSYAIIGYEDEWKQPVRVEGGANDDYDLRTVDYYYCGLVVGGNHIPFRTFNVAPYSMFQWESTNPATRNGSYTGFAGPGRLNTRIQYGSESAPYKPPTVRSELTRDGYGIVVLIRRDDITYSGTARRGPCDITAIDIHGNEHQLRVNFVAANNRHALKLTKR